MSHLTSNQCLMRPFTRLVTILGGLVLVTLIFFKPSESSAFGLDPLLHGLCDNCNTPAPTPRESAFDGLTKAYGLALAPPHLSPANTIGINAFEIDFAYSLALLGGDTNTWAPAVIQGSVPSTLSTTHIMIRKGLPYSFEVEGHLGYMVNTELFTIGGSFKWSLHEAVSAFPIDFMVRGSALRLVGSTQLEMSTLGLDASLGTQFGVLKLFNLAPYLSYSPVQVTANSTTLDATPGAFDAPGSSLAMGNVATSFVYGRRDHVTHRFGLGMRWLVGLLKITPEFIWSPNQSQISVSLGLHL